MNWNNITVGQFQSIYIYLNLIADIVKNELDEDKLNESLFNFNCRMIEIIYGLSNDQVLDLSTKQFQECCDKIAFVFQPVEKTDIKRFYELGGKKFTVTKTIGALNELTVRDLKAIQYVDLIHMNTQDDVAKKMANIHKELAIIMIPEGESYGSESYSVSENAEIIKNNLSIVDALTISNFFFESLKALIKVTVNSSVSRLRKKVKKADKEEKEKIEKTINSLLQVLSLPIGDGLTVLEESLKLTTSLSGMPVN